MAAILKRSPAPACWRPGSAAPKFMLATPTDCRSARAAVLALALAWSASAAPADAVYVNGYVYTVDAREAVHEALVVRDGRIAYVGPNAGARALAGSATRVIDLKGRLLMPGLVDGH